MKKWIWIILALVLSACSGYSTNQADSQSLPDADGDAMPQPSMILEDHGPAPEWENDVWLNTDRPLRLADLRGQVVLLDMWTFG